MEIVAGSRLGPYEIVSRIGAGGMGEVFRAHDPRLGRDVAVKVLPPEFARSEQARLRFQREARVISQLSHPNICTLHDVGEQDGTVFLVMELIDGETLSARLSKGPLPIAEVLRYGGQIAAALQKAHSAGIIHRDLKPGNIMLTRTGVRLLDFGLARAVTAAPIGHDSLTAIPLTEEGMVVGTLQYMAPEQLEGLEVDARADIFAFGAVLYEMITGTRAFSGESRMSVMSAIVTGTPRAMSELRPETPRRLEELVNACLDKVADDRLQSAHDAGLELQWIETSPKGSAVAAAPVKRSLLPWVAVAILALACAVLGAIHFTRPTPASHAIRFTITPPTGLVLTRSVLSPDGRRLLLRGVNVDGSSSLWLRTLDGVEAKAIAGTEGAFHQFWSPDSRQIAWFGKGKLWRMNLDEASPVALADVRDSGAGGSWSANGTIVFAPALESNLMRVSATGGAAVNETTLDGAGKVHAWPAFLPDGEHYLYAVSGGAKGTDGLYVGSLGTRDRQLLVPYGSVYDMAEAAYAGGRLFYVRDRNLIARPFDRRTLTFDGDEATVVEGIVAGPGLSTFTVAANGTVVYQTAGPAILTELSFVDRTGRSLTPLAPPGPYSEFTVSSDGRTIAYSGTPLTGASVAAVSLYDTQRQVSTRVTSDLFASTPVWAPDGRTLIHTIANDGPPNLVMDRMDGSPRTRLTNAYQQQYPQSVSPDGRYVLFNIHPVADVYAVSTIAPYQVVPVVTGPGRQTGGEVSADGEWVVYRSNESGRGEIYAAPFLRSGMKVQISTHGGRRAHWSASGREILYYEDESRRVMSVAIRKQASSQLDVSAPQPLFEAAGDYQYMKDGRFVVAKNSLNPGAPPVTVLMNWVPPTGR
jgi:Tol biopolymer transport system component